MSPFPSQLLRALSRHWSGRLAAYRQHRNDEHTEALLAEAMQYIGLRLESDLSRSPYWSGTTLLRRAAVLLYLVDRGAVTRSSRQGRAWYEPVADAEDWAAAQPALAPYLAPTLEFLAALRHDQARRQMAAE